MEHTFPLEIWKLILSRSEFGNILSWSTVCRLFNYYVEGMIEVVHDPKISKPITYDKIEKFHRLKACYLNLIRLNNIQIGNVINFRVLSVIMPMSAFDDIWLPYWTAPQRTQTEFNSISHRIVVRIDDIESYEPYHKPYIPIDISDGKIYGCNITSTFYKLIEPLIERYYLALCSPNSIIDGIIKNNLPKITDSQIVRIY